MTKIFDVYKCNICGNIVEINHKGNGTLTCCGMQMELLKPNTEEGDGAEKHIPVVARKSTGYLIKVGSIAHPMTKDHLIEWIEIITDENKIYKKTLPQEQTRNYYFKQTATASKSVATATCTVSGV